VGRHMVEQHSKKKLAERRAALLRHAVAPHK
jgi:hypothetical protein